MTLRVFLADDEPLALGRLRTLLEAAPDVEVVGTAQDGDEAAAEIARLTPDLAFLDIRMPKQSGLPLARSLRDVVSTEVVFVTAFDHFALEAFEADAVDYLLKPVDADRLAIALMRARRRRAIVDPRAAPDLRAPADAELNYEGFWVERRKGGRIWIPLSVILWIEAARDYVILHTETGSHL
ncbi:response regulator, partial [bacterium]